MVRAYSMANYPGEQGIIMLNVRVASPPPRAPEGTPPGKMSSYIFSAQARRQGHDQRSLRRVLHQRHRRRNGLHRWWCRMAPLRSHIFELFKRKKTNRKVTYWYGGRSMRELFYVDHFRKIEEEFPNFKFNIALSEPLPEDNWTGYKGFIHQVLLENYLKNHPAPEDIEYYICGPPMMNAAVFKMLDDLGVEPENIAYDDFGG